MISFGKEIVTFIFFMISVVAAVFYNFTYSDTSGYTSLDLDDLEAWPTQTKSPEVTICEPENTLSRIPAVATAGCSPTE
jgi:hypothetical protein